MSDRRIVKNRLHLRRLINQSAIPPKSFEIHILTASCPLVVVVVVVVGVVGLAFNIELSFPAKEKMNSAAYSKNVDRLT
jgi:hypothetical protein